MKNEEAKVKDMHEAVKPHADKLARIINKAIAGGFKLPDWPAAPSEQLNLSVNIILLNAAPSIIFIHDFAAAYWGRKPIEDGKIWPAWEYHIQKMALEFDRIGYLEKFL
jgi:hypothetical protein